MLDQDTKKGNFPNPRNFDYNTENDTISQKNFNDD